MYCPSCGKEIPDKSAFCLHCGKPTTSSKEKIEFEYCDYKIDMTKSSKSKEMWVPAETYTTVAARLHFWQAVQEVVMEKLQEYFDNGWQPVTEVGAAMIQIDYQSGNFFGNRPDRHLFTGISLKLRRPKKT